MLLVLYLLDLLTVFLSLGEGGGGWGGGIKNIKGSGWGVGLGDI